MAGRHEEKDSAYILGISNDEGYEQLGTYQEQIEEPWVCKNAGADVRKVRSKQASICSLDKFRPVTRET